jgi:hypothetical protein
MSDPSSSEDAEIVAQAATLKTPAGAVPQRAKKQIAIGDLLPGGQTIASILGQSTTVTVFTTTGNELRWTYHGNQGQLPSPHLKIISRFDTLMAEVSAGVPKKFREKAFVQLGKALFSAIDSGDVDGMETHFAPVSNFIRSKAVPPARLQYILGSTGAGVVLSSAFIVGAQFFQFADTPASFIIVGGLGGSIGGVISVLQRSNSIDVDYNWDTQYIVMQGVARIVLGALFGMFAVFACAADFIAGFAKGDVTSLMVLSVVGGLSERFVPEIVHRLEAGQIKA